MSARSDRAQVAGALILAVGIAAAWSPLAGVAVLPVAVAALAWW